MPDLSPDLQRRLSIVIPAYNEEDGIEATLTGLTARLPEAEIIVIDDASTDGTAAKVGAFAGVRLLSHDFNRGYGGALKSGMLAASRDMVAWFDADNEHRVEDLIGMVETIEARRLAAVIGQRPHGGPSLLRTSGKWTIRQVARLFRVSPGADFNCGLRVFRRDVIVNYLGTLPDGFSASVTSLMVMLERGYPIAFYPVHTNPRIGTSKVTLSDGFATLIIVLRLIMLFAPLRIFLPAGIILFLLGAAYSLYEAIRFGEGIPVAGLLIVLVGVLCAMMGMIADQVSQLRLSMLNTMPVREPPANRPPE